MMTNKSLLVIALCGVATSSLVGCSDAPPVRPEPTWEQAASDPLLPANYKAADALLTQVMMLNKEQPLIAATVVNIDALEKSSTLGRLITEQVSGRFAQAGYRLVEMKFRNSVYVKQNQGELMLTREIKDLASSYDAQAVIVGTYGASNDFVYVNLKVIQPATNVVLAVHDYVLPLNSTIKALAY